MSSTPETLEIVAVEKGSYLTSFTDRGTEMDVRQYEGVYLGMG